MTTQKIENLRGGLENFIVSDTQTFGGDEEVNPMPTPGFERVIQYTILEVTNPKNNKKEVTGAEVLISIYKERDRSVEFLHRYDVTRSDLQAFVYHGVRKGEWRTPKQSLNSPL